MMMKTVHLITQEFICTPEAAVLLEQYSATLKEYFANNDEYDDDVVEDILIACEQKLLGYVSERADTTLLEEDVKKVMRQLGTTDLLATTNSAETTPLPQKFYRDRKHGIVAGVCAGLATYLNLPTRIVRLSFVLLSFVSFIGVIVYLLLWYIIPPIQSKSDELRTIGKSVSIKTLTQDISPYTKQKVKGLVKRLGILAGIGFLLLAVLASIIVLFSIFDGNGYKSFLYSYRCADGTFVDIVYNDPKLQSVSVASEKLGGMRWFEAGESPTSRISPKLNAKVTTADGNRTITVTQGANILHDVCLISTEHDKNGNIYVGLGSDSGEDNRNETIITTLFDTSEFGHDLLMQYAPYGSLAFNSFVSSPDSADNRYLQGLANDKRVPVVIDTSLITVIDAVSGDEGLIYRTAPILEEKGTRVVSSLGLFQYSNELRLSVHLDTLDLGEEQKSGTVRSIVTLNDDDEADISNKTAQLEVTTIDDNGLEMMSTVVVGKAGFEKN